MSEKELHCAVERAKQLGTYNAIDRSKQYPLDNPGKVTEAINKCWAKVHGLEQQNQKKDREIGDLRSERKELKRWLRALTVAVSIEGAIIGWLATNLLRCIELGHRFAELWK